MQIKEVKPALSMEGDIDELGEMNMTVCEATKHFTELTLEEFVAEETRGESEDILERLHGRQWILYLGKIISNRRPYVWVEHVVADSKKELFPDVPVPKILPKVVVAVETPSTPPRLIPAFSDSRVYDFGESATVAVCNRRSIGMHLSRS
ncbi:hypothetical protein R1flu_019400 [Riccia fluitans]|uniref:Uncharacterized protein n=1 Tax=Riccia fluitans TaxID=41844 RepID=A0ABD1ZIJ1_9MARC